MKTFLAMMIFLTGQAFASHPHDVVCTGSTMLGQIHEDFILQHTIGRTYENGNPNEDPHVSSVELRRCPDDYVQEDCSFAAVREIRIKPGQSIDLDLNLVDSKKRVLFKGKLLFGKVKTELVGKMTDYYSDKLVEMKAELHCASQPWVNLKAATTDGH